MITSPNHRSELQPFIQHAHDMDAIQSAFGHDAALCDRILAAASKFYL